MIRILLWWYAFFVCNELLKLFSWLYLVKTFCYCFTDLWFPSCFSFGLLSAFTLSKLVYKIIWNFCNCIGLLILFINNPNCWRHVSRRFCIFLGNFLNLLLIIFHFAISLIILLSNSFFLNTRLLIWSKINYLFELLFAISQNIIFNFFFLWDIFIIYVFRKFLNIFCSLISAFPFFRNIVCSVLFCIICVCLRLSNRGNKRSLFQHFFNVVIRKNLNLINR